MPRMIVIAAEASADVHAAKVVRALLDEEPEAEIFGLAGPALRELGVEAVARTEEISVMGLIEVLPALPRILRVMKRLWLAARARRPDMALLVDSPDLNLRMARRLRKLGIPILYYIAPMVWAWRRGRVKKVGRLVDRLCVILPFEEEIWTDGGVSAVYVGSPLLDHGSLRLALPPGKEGDHSAGEETRAPEALVGKAELRAALGLTGDRLTIAVLPGSRKSEIRRCLPDMLRAVALLAKARSGDVQVVLPRAPTIEPGFIEEVAGHALGDLPLHISSDGAEAVLGVSDAAVIASGTATLEAVLSGTPMVVVYRMAWLTWLAAKLLVRTPYASLPNLLAGRQVVVELLQSEMRPEAIANELSRLVPGGGRREEMLADLAEIRGRMGGPGAAIRVATEAMRLMGRQKRGEDG